MQILKSSFKTIRFSLLPCHENAFYKISTSFIFKKCLRSILLTIFFWPSLCLSYEQDTLIKTDQLNDTIRQSLMVSHEFTGLSSFYNNIYVFSISEGMLSRMEKHKDYEFSQPTGIAIAARNKVLFLSDVTGKVNFSGSDFTEASLTASKKTSATVLLKSVLKDYYPILADIHFFHLWKPLRFLAIKIESLLVLLNNMHSLGMGLSIFLLSFLYKMVIFPVSYMNHLQQNKVSQIKSKLTPALDQIKKSYTGEEAHRKYIEAHKNFGVTPYYSLRPFLTTLVPIPVLIAIFNVLGESSFLISEPFLWVNSLSVPDCILELNFTIPVLGECLRLLPIFMLTVSVISALFYKNKSINPFLVKRKKLNIISLSIILFILFYPFPSAMILFWLSTTVISTLMQRLYE